VARLLASTSAERAGSVVAKDAQETRGRALKESRTDRVVVHPAGTNHRGVCGRSR
jgi:hypothetical protein